MLKNNKSLGQHWLKDRQILNEIASLASEDAKSDFCLEIGPGLGTLTSSLLRCFQKVLAVEYDERLAKNLPKSFPGKNLEVKNADFLKFDLNSVPTPFVVAGNIPYYITSPIIEKLLTAENPPERIVLLIQKEVAERIAAENGKESILSLMCKNRSLVTLGPVVRREYFTPPPKVDSQIIIFHPQKSPEVPEEVLNLARRTFRMPRKKLTANLSSSEGISRLAASEALISINVSPDSRPEDLSLKDWNALAQIIKKQ